MIVVALLSRHFGAVGSASEQWLHSLTLAELVCLNLSQELIAVGASLGSTVSSAAVVEAFVGEENWSDLLTNPS